MKLIFITHRFSAPVTGGELYNQALLESAEKAGCSIEVWEGMAYGKLKKSIVIMNCMYLFKSLSQKQRCVFLYDTDFHMRYFVSICWIALLKKHMLVGVLHHYNYLCRREGLKKRIQKYFEAAVSRRFDFLIANGKFSKRCFLAFSKRQISIYILNPFSVDSNLQVLKHSCFSKTQFRLVLVGTIEYRKNIDTVIRALSETDAGVTLDVVGKIMDKKYFLSLQKLIESLSLSQRVRFLGKIDRAALRNAYQRSNCFILASRMEGYGMVYAEAMCFGLPIIGSTAGAVPELVEHNVNGILCDPENHLQIAQAIGNIMKIDNWKTISKNNIAKSSSLLTREAFVGLGTGIFTDIAGRIASSRTAVLNAKSISL